MPKRREILGKMAGVIGSATIAASGVSSARPSDFTTTLEVRGKNGGGAYRIVANSAAQDHDQNEGGDWVKRESSPTGELNKRIGGGVGNGTDRYWIDLPIYYVKVWGDMVIDLHGGFDGTDSDSDPAYITQVKGSNGGGNYNLRKVYGGINPGPGGSLESNDNDLGDEVEGNVVNSSDQWESFGNYTRLEFSNVSGSVVVDETSN